MQIKICKIKCINICQGVHRTAIHKVLLCNLLRFPFGENLHLASATNVVSLQFVRVPPPDPPAQVDLKLMKNNLKVCEYMYNRLQELRWEKDWSQTQLAMKSNVSHSTISLIENNPLENPHVYTAIKLAHALGVSVEDIFKL